MIINLYTTSACHLCEQAMALLEAFQAQLPADKAIEVRSVDIIDDEALVELYGIRIPVLKRLDNATELGWPFDLNKLENFLFESAEGSLSDPSD